jgi:2-polyprenyl-6-methoxyphenol hydroxylase-like FAD-dependent oxidoreductase
MKTAAFNDVQVLIVGGGPTGLAASLLLSRFGVRSLLVERHPGTSIYPRATGINVRTMEILRSLGLEEEVRRASFTAVPRIARSRVLIDPVVTDAGSLREEISAPSPSRWTSCSQFELEPILARAAAAQPKALLQFGTELTDFEQSTQGVVSRVTDRATGDVTEVRSEYLVAADGARSPVRERLGVSMQGPGEMMRLIGIHFRAPLRQLMPHDPYFLHFVEAGNEPCLFATTDSDSRWMLNVPVESPEGKSRMSLDHAELAGLIRERAGVPDLDVQVQGTVEWTLQADWAERYRLSRVFLAGDAAHRMTPAGGHGLNTGVQDAHNLAWKMAAVLDGWADDSLLETYETERMPIGRFNAMHSVELISGAPSGRSDQEIDLGFVYGANGSGQPTFDLSVRPGARAPHMWLDGDTSTLDLFGHGFMLLTGAQDRGWAAAVESLATERSVRIGHRKMPGGEWNELYGVSDTGAVLVRPDGHVAWRAESATRNERFKLAQALDASLGRRPDLESRIA